MTRRWASLAAALVVLLAVVLAWGALAGAVDGSTAPAGDSPSSGPPASAADAANRSDSGPGEGISGAVAVQGARLDQSMVVAEFQARLDDAETARARAQVVASAVDRTATRLPSLEQRLQRLRTGKENGSVGQRAYAVRVAPVAASAQSLDALLDRVASAAEEIDSDLLRDAGVDPGQIERLQSRADDVAAAGEGVVTTSSFDRAFFGRVARLVDTYNEDAGSYDLGILGRQVSGERINLHVVAEGGDRAVVSFRTTEDNRIRQLRAGPRGDATLRVTVGKRTADRILDADEPGVAASEAFVDGEIRVDGLGWFNALKWVLLNLVVDLVGLVVGLAEWVVSLVP